MILLGLTDVASVRQALVQELDRMREVDPDGAAGQMVDLQGASFLADEGSVLGEVDLGYVSRELQWYMKQSLNVADIPGGAPKIWRDVASNGGYVNSNYGYLFHSPDNGVGGKSQFEHVVEELRRDPSSRRAVAVYTRPTMHYDAYDTGMTDFVCTNAVNYRLTPGWGLDAVVQMRSNDAVFGYRNDQAWQRFALTETAMQLGVEPKNLVWQAASFHVYPRHHHLVDTFKETGEWDVPVRKPKEAAA